MRRCKKGHNTDETGRYQNGGCVICKREYSARRAAAQGGWRAKPAGCRPRSGKRDNTTVTMAAKIIELRCKAETLPHWQREEIMQQIAEMLAEVSA